MHSQPRAAPPGLIEGAPPVDKINIPIILFLSPGLGGGTSPEGLTDTIFFVNINVTGDEIWA
jgi:hypothetical protein